MSRINKSFLGGIPNAAATSFTLNDKALNQAKLPTKHGQSFTGLHWNLGFTLDETGIQTMNAVHGDLFATMQRFSNFKTPYTRANLMAYNTLANFLDAAIAEWRRDLAMYKWRDTLSVDAMADFWGPSYNQVINDFSNLPGYEMVFNNLASRCSSSFPHVDIPVYKNLEYMLGNVFSDNSSNRKNWIYFHMFNNSCGTAAPGINHASTWVAHIANMLDGTAPNPALCDANGENMVPYIVADIMKVFGNDAYHDYPLIAEHPEINAIYDEDLLMALINRKGFPIPYTNGAITMRSQEWDDTTVAEFTESVSLSGIAMKTEDFHFEAPECFDPDTNTTGYFQLGLALGLYNGMDFMYTGAMQGQSILTNTAFRPKYSSTSGGAGRPNNIINIHASSPFGIYLTNLWTCSKSVLNDVEWITDQVYDTYLSVGNYHANGAPSYTNISDWATVPWPLLNAATKFANCDAGVVKHVSVGDSVIEWIVGEDIDEYAILSESQLDLMRSSVMRSYYDVGVTKYKPSNAETFGKGSKVSKGSRTKSDYISEALTKRTGNGGTSRGGGVGRR